MKTNVEKALQMLLRVSIVTGKMDPKIMDIFNEMGKPPEPEERNDPMAVFKGKGSAAKSQRD